MAKLLGSFKEIQEQIVEESKADIQQIEGELSQHMTGIFSGFQVKVDTRSNEVSEKQVNIFGTKSILRMGPDDGHMAPIEKQGSGARRTLLWAALKMASERGGSAAKMKSKSGTAVSDAGAEAAAEMTRPHVLLLDEPENCLHPNAIRDACKVLYDLAENNVVWQVMVTTHSPVFIDISRDNTTIVRVERNEQGAVTGTTIFRPDRVRLSDEEKEMLKYLNQWDPYVGEFFFGGRTIIVEGDTEYSAFREIVESNRKKYRDVHVVRARGKYIVPILVKIMNHFGSKYAVLHDTDKKFLPNGNANSAWAANSQILEAVTASNQMENIRLVASKVDFEHAIFGAPSSDDKPFRAVKRIRSSEEARAKVTSLLDYLLFLEDACPEGIIPYKCIDDIENVLAM